mmetsp:Transcript_9357/g.17387  ORF Transcript_9357/g.17387 Transcript_9357/m.17387 type:complete len:248 (+) Transcript_9357:1045-1788(+)
MVPAETLALSSHPPGAQLQLVTYPTLAIYPQNVVHRHQEAVQSDSWMHQLPHSSIHQPLHSWIHQPPQSWIHQLLHSWIHCPWHLLPFPPWLPPPFYLPPACGRTRSSGQNYPSSRSPSLLQQQSVWSFDFCDSPSHSVQKPVAARAAVSAAAAVQQASASRSHQLAMQHQAASMSEEKLQEISMYWLRHPCEDASSGVNENVWVKLRPLPGETGDRLMKCLALPHFSSDICVHGMWRPTKPVQTQS